VSTYLGIAAAAAGASLGSVLGVAAATQWARRQQAKELKAQMDAAKSRMASLMGLHYDPETGEVDCGHDECRVEREERREFAEEMADAMDDAGGEPLYESLRREYAYRVRAGTDLHTADELRSAYGFTESEATELLVRLRREFGVE
jgi:hypothetical protein